MHGAPVTALFTPHLVPMTRGLLASCYARPAADGLTTAGLLDTYRDVYADEPFVAVLDEPPDAPARPSGRTPRTSPSATTTAPARILAFAALDNLGKGAAGQAIQAANLVLGLPEPTGLPAVGIMP